MRKFFMFVCACLIALPLMAVEPDEILDDPALEARARAISANVRCVVCQNEPIDSSNAGVARDLRILLRERLKAGDTDEEVYAYLVARYGEYVLFKPPFKPSTYLLWIGPFLILLMGTIGVVVSLRSKSGKAPVALNEKEIERIDALLDQKDKAG